MWKCGQLLRLVKSYFAQLKIVIAYTVQGKKRLKYMKWFCVRENMWSYF